jgi:hypothetical protein
MTIRINGVNRDEKSAIGFISKPARHVEQIVHAWHKSKINHRFENKHTFRKTVKKNRKTLETPRITKRLFTSSNYLFSTKAKHRLETLYFKDKANKQTGRLRQQHRKGPLAKIDKKARKHLFPISKERQKKLYKLIKKNQIPRICPGERQPEDGKYHIEFARTGKRVSRWHWSEGKVANCKRDDGRTQRERDDPKRRIASSLKNILGI